MKLESILLRTAALAVIATFAGLAFNAVALALFATAASAFVVLIATGDYARRPDYAGVLARPRRRALLPLAA